MNLDISKKYTILYAEDEDEIRDGYGDFLKTIFKDVYLACDGGEALKLYNTFNPDILLLDISMPKIDGLTLVEKLRQEGKTTPTIILTAHMDQNKLLKAIPLGISSYLVKPVKRKDLEISLAKVLKKLELQSYNESIVTLGNDTSWNTMTKILECENVMVSLTKSEIMLIEILISHKNKYISVATISKIFQNEYNQYNVSEDAVRNSLKRLRKKVPPKLIANSHGLGYKI